jgi:hypothetical protein
MGPVKRFGATVCSVLATAAFLLLTIAPSLAQDPPVGGSKGDGIPVPPTGVIKADRTAVDMSSLQTPPRVPGVPNKNLITVPFRTGYFEPGPHALFRPEDLKKSLLSGTRGGPPQDRDITLTAADVLQPRFAQSDTRIWFASNASGVTEEGRLDYDGTNIAYHIWRTDLEGNHAQQLTGGDPDYPQEQLGEQMYPDVNLASNVLVYCHRSTPGSGDFDVYVRFLSTSLAPIRIDFDPNRPIFDAIHPSLDPSGRYAVFSGQDAQGGDYKLFYSRIDGQAFPDGTFVKQITNPAAGINHLSPDWSPDGRLIAFTRVDASGNERIYMVEFGSQFTIQYTNFEVGGVPSKDRDPNWRRDGNRMQFASTRKARYLDDEGQLVLQIHVPANEVGTSYDIYQFNPAIPEDATLNVPMALTKDPMDNTGEGATDPTEAYDRNMFVYISDRPNPPINAGLHDAWAGLFEDVTPPLLEVLPTVEPKEAMPGQQVKITAYVTDLQSGVERVYVQFKDPDGAEFDSEGVEHRLYILLPGNIPRAAGALPVFPDTSHQMDLFVEISQEVVNPYTYGYAWPWVMAGGAGEADLRDGLPLFDDGPLSEGGHEPEGEVAKDGFYTNTWATPYQPSDYYVDVLVEDKDANQLIYDNITGFTTAPFSSQNPILFVADYIAGQLFVQDLNYDPLLGRMFARTTWAPVESYWTRNPATHGEHAWFYNTSGDRDIPYLPYPWGLPYPRTGETLDTLGPTAVFQECDIWRTQCRYPMQLSVMAQYLPRIDQQVDPNNPEGTRDVLVAERAAVWASPYISDLWVEPVGIGTEEIRQVVQQYLDAAGRLVLSGQDIAWGLTQNGQLPSPFLNNYFRTRFVDDVSTDVGQVLYTAMRHRLLDDSDVATTGPWDYHWIRPDGEIDDWSAQNFLADPAQLITGLLGLLVPATWIAGSTLIDGAWNQLWIDSVEPVGTVDVGKLWNAYRYSSGGDAGIAVHHQGTRSKTFFMAYGLEGIHSSHRTISLPIGDFAWSDSRRYEELHGILCWMRTTRAYGKVEAIDPQTQQKKPEPGVLVRYIAGNAKDPDTIGQVLGAALTDDNGEYVITGLPPGHYFVDAMKPGFRIGHPEAIRSLHGGQVEKSDANTLNLIITKEPPGSVNGRVVNQNGQPVQNVIVTLDSTFPGIADETGITNSEGEFDITAGAGTWIVTVDGTHLGYGDVSQPEEVEVEVQSGLPTTIDSGNPSPYNDAFILFGKTGNLIGTVTSSEDASPIEGAQIVGRITTIGGPETVGPAVTGPDGTYDFGAQGFDLAPGNYRLTASAFGFRTETSQIDVLSEQTVTKDFELDPVPPRTLRGYVGVKVSQTQTIPAPEGLTVIVELNDIEACQTLTTELMDPEGTPYNYEFAEPDCKLGDNLYEVEVDTTGTGFKRPDPVSVFVPAGDEEPVGVPAYAPDITLEPLATFGPFSALISVPINYAGLDPKAILGGGTGFKLTAWDRADRLFKNYPLAPADELVLGRGYFLENDEWMALTTPGEGADEDVPFPIAIKEGWNLIGDPFEFSVNLQGSFVDGPTGIVTFEEAVYAGWVAPMVWWVFLGYPTLRDTLDAFNGYWFLAYQDVTLLVDPHARVAPIGGRLPFSGRSFEPRDGWLLNLQVATDSGLKDMDSFIGVSADATDGWDNRFDMARPPSADERFVGIAFRHDDWGDRSGRYMSDVKGLATTKQVWHFTVDTTDAGATLTLRWPSMSSLPRNVNLVLIDEVTGKRQFMRSSSSYSFTMSDAGSRPFRIETIGSGRVLRITNPVAQTTRAGSVTVSFSLSTEANLVVTVLDASGRPIRQVENNVSAAAGAQTASWDGRDSRGVSMPPGMYTIHIQATTEDGQIARAVTPVLLKR